MLKSSHPRSEKRCKEITDTHRVLRHEGSVPSDLGNLLVRKPAEIQYAVMLCKSVNSLINGELNFTPPILW